MGITKIDFDPYLNNIEIGITFHSRRSFHGLIKIMVFEPAKTEIIGYV